MYRILYIPRRFVKKSQVQPRLKDVQTARVETVCRSVTSKSKQRFAVPGLVVALRESAILVEAA
jgi:hypothetical protein